MSFQGRFKNTIDNKKTFNTGFVIFTDYKNASLNVVLFAFAALLLTGCVSDKTNEDGILLSYQQILANQDYKFIDDTDSNQPLDIFKTTYPAANNIYDVEITTDPNTGQRNVNLSIEQVLVRTLANSPEIRVVSFNPSIKKQNITRETSQFDPTAFSELNYEKDDNPANSIYQSGQSDERSLQTGIKQKSITGSEWTLSYAYTRTWDDLSGRTLSTRYEPILSFKLKQPLLRDAWQEITLAGVDVAKLNYKTSLLAFRQKAEEVAVGVISAYWQLLQAQRNMEIHQRLLDSTLETLEKVTRRKEIDATELHIKQTEASAKAREAALIKAKKQVIDAQDVLLRLMADAQLSVLDNFNIIPVSEPIQECEKFDCSKLIESALINNPIIQQAKLEIEIADINIRIAENQDMPRLDMLASARVQGLDRGPDNAYENFTNGDYFSYGLGLSLEYPLGNRQREAELIQRRFERRQAVTVQQNVSYQAAQLIRERARRVETSYSEIQVQKEAVEAARIHLEVLEDTETIREQLTPEFLLVKLQAQEILANAQMAEAKAIADLNIAFAELAQTMGTVLNLHQVENSLLQISEISATSE
ncbi:MAG: TolC family protein [Sedimentisphaerales bacterium]|nr:TolC family protein [Sedimentisphaerales bacterium]